jgi:hypothetical protein
MAGQGREAYRHIAAGASLQLNRLGYLVYAGDAHDIWQGLTDNYFDGSGIFGDGGRGGWAQRAAEIAGNLAGMSAGRMLGDYKREKISTNDLRSNLRNELCK